MNSAPRAPKMLFVVILAMALAGISVANGDETDDAQSDSGD